MKWWALLHRQQGEPNATRWAPCYKVSPVLLHGECTILCHSEPLLWQGWDSMLEYRWAFTAPGWVYDMPWRIVSLRCYRVSPNCYMVSRHCSRFILYSLSEKQCLVIHPSPAQCRQTNFAWLCTTQLHRTCLTMPFLSVRDAMTYKVITHPVRSLRTAISGKDAGRAQHHVRPPAGH